MQRGLTFRAALASAAVAAIVMGGFLTMLVVNHNLHAVERSDSRSGAVIAAATSLQFSVLELEDGLRGYEIAGKAPFLEHFWHALGAYPGQAWLLERLTAPDAAAHSQAVAITAAIRHYEVSWAYPLVVLSETDAAAARRTTANGPGQALVDAILARLSALDRHEQAAVSAHHRNADRVAELAFGLGVAAAGLCTLAVALLAIGAQRRVVRPVHRIAAAVAQVRRGDLSVRVPAHGALEIRDLAGGFNAMADYLQTRRDEVIEQHAELESQGNALRDALAAVEEQRAWAESLHRFGAQLAEQRSDVDALCAVSLREIADYLGATVGCVRLLDEQAWSYVLRASRGFAPGEAVGRRLPLRDGPAGQAMAEQRPVTATYPETSLHLTNDEIRHELHLPLQRGGVSFGVISLGRRSEFTAADVTAAGALAEAAAVACAATLGLRRAEVLAQELQALMESTDEGICLTDVPGRITFINRAALEQIGYEADEVLGREAHEVMHHSYPDGTPFPTADCPLAPTRLGEAGVRLSNEVFWRKDGTPFPVEVSVYRVKDGTTVTGNVSLFIDISARKRAERQLAAQYRTARVLVAADSVEEALPRVLDALGDELGWQIILGWTPAGGDELRCTAVHASTGHSGLAEELASATIRMGQGLVGRAWQRQQPMFCNSATGEVTAAPNDAASSGTGSTGRPGGWLRGELAVPIIADSAVIGVLELAGHDQVGTPGMLQTIETIASQVAQYAHRKQAEQAAALMKDQFVATVSHELRTPLTAIDGWLHILLGGEPGPLTAEQTQFLATVKENSERLMQLVGDLLLIGQIDAGHVIVESADVDVADLATETARLFAKLAAEKDVEIAVDASAAVIVRGDKLRLGQLLGNLVSNAVKFTPQGGRVRIRAVQHDRSCLIEVTDTGIGIPAAERDHLFERFYRGATARENGITGTGLGLAVCKTMAEAHHGTIRVADGPGGGTRFIVELPLAVRQEARL